MRLKPSRKKFLPGETVQAPDSFSDVGLSHPKDALNGIFSVNFEQKTLIFFAYLHLLNA